MDNSKTARQAWAVFCSCLLLAASLLILAAQARARTEQAQTATQTIQLVAGWNTISSNIDPGDPLLENMLAGIAAELVLLKNDAGQLYWPDQGIDSIGNWNANQGYQVYMSGDAALTIGGEAIAPSSSPLLLPAGWSLIAYQQPGGSSPAQVLAPYNGQLLLARDGLGQVYWPDFGIDQIGSMQPGQGYWIYLLSPSGLNTPPQILSGDIAFQKRVLSNEVMSAHAVVAADLDRDGDMDVAATDSWRAKVFWLRNDGQGNFTQLVLDSFLDQAYPMHAGDVNLDGHVDIMAGGYASDSFRWYRNEGGGSFSTFLIGDQTDGAHSIVNGDLDKDGDQDFITSSQDAGIIAWYENDGSFNFTEHVVDSTADTVKRAEMADIDGDGYLDIVSASFGDNTIAWHENNGSQQFTKHVIDSNAAGAYYAYAADLDGDLDIDVLGALMAGSKVTWYKNNGSGGFTRSVIDSSAINVRTVLGADIDLDGDTDALAASVGDNTVAWYVNNGSGVFSKKVIDSNALGAYGVFAIDMDHDGDIDVLSATRDGDEVILYTQVKAHVATISQGATLLIDQSRLQAWDAQSFSGQLIYTLSTAPQRGVLRLSGEPLAQGDTFTQADINNGRLSYRHTATNTTADNFSFAVADGGEQGVQPPTGTFRVRISAP